MNDIPRYVVIPHYNRPGVALQCIESVKAQSDTIFVVENSDTNPLSEPDETLTPYYLLPYEEHPVNLSKAWNIGLDAAEKDARRMGAPRWDVAILNDDALVPAGWYDAVSKNMRSQGAAAGCSGPHLVTLKAPGPVPLSMRMQGWAFMITGETGLRADETFRWWFGDSDLDWQARRLGGMAMVKGYYTQNMFADQSTRGTRAIQAQEDARQFDIKWNGLKAW